MAGAGPAHPKGRSASGGSVEAAILERSGREEAARSAASTAGKIVAGAGFAGTGTAIGPPAGAGAWALATTEDRRPGQPVRSSATDDKVAASPPRRQAHPLGHHQRHGTGNWPDGRSPAEPQPPGWRCREAGGPVRGRRSSPCGAGKGREPGFARQPQSGRRQDCDDERRGGRRPAGRRPRPITRHRTGRTRAPIPRRCPACRCRCRSAPGRPTSRAASPRPWRGRSPRRGSRG